MKVKELIEVLKTFDGELEVMTFESELCEYFPVTMGDSIFLTEVCNAHNGNIIISTEDFDIGDDYDESTIKEVLVIR